MSAIRYELIHAVLNKTLELLDHNVHNDLRKKYEYRQNFVLADKSLTKDEKIEAIRRLNGNYDNEKLFYNEGTKRICENCQLECLATSFCEHCVRNHLKSKFSNWTSGNDDIDNLIQKCQMEIFRPSSIVEWIPYNNLQNIEFLTKGGFSEIYTAIWSDGSYDKWDPEEQTLKRFGLQKVALKKLENVESAKRSWFEEVCDLNQIKVHN